MHALNSVLRGVLIALVGFGLTACAGTSSTETMLADDDPNRIICRDDINTGSRLKKKTCRTKAEWDEIAEKTAEMQRGLQRDTAEGAITDGSRM